MHDKVKTKQMLLSILDNMCIKVVTQIQLHTSSATTVLSSVTLYTNRGQFDWQNLVFLNMHKAINLLPMKSHVTITYSSFSMMSYWDFLTNADVLNGKYKT